MGAVRVAPRPPWTDRTSDSAARRGGSARRPHGSARSRRCCRGSWCTGFKASEQPAGLTWWLRPDGPGTLHESVLSRLDVPQIADPVARVFLYVRRASPRRSGHVRADSGDAQGNRLSMFEISLHVRNAGVTLGAGVRGVNGANWNGYRKRREIALGPDGAVGRRPREGHLVVRCLCLLLARRADLPIVRRSSVIRRGVFRLSGLCATAEAVFWEVARRAVRAGRRSRVVGPVLKAAAKRFSDLKVRAVLDIEGAPAAPRSALCEGRPQRRER